MPTGTIAYKPVLTTQTEVLDIDEGLWDHIRLATSFIETRGGGPARRDQAASAVMIRSGGGAPVVVVLMDRQAPQMPADQNDLCERFNLTPRESEVALLLAQRMSCREIANRLNMTFNTARCHTERIMAKLEVRSKNDVRTRLGVMT